MSQMPQATRKIIKVLLTVAELTVKTLVTLAIGNTVLLETFGVVGFDLFILPNERSQITSSMYTTLAMMETYWVNQDNTCSS